MDDKINSLCVDELKRQLRYNQDTGTFTRLIANSNHPKAQIGMIAGCKTVAGYISISINNVEYMAHQLAWLYRYEEYATHIDHRDQDKSNNRIFNLRKSTKAQNAINSGLYSDNTSGYKGVGWHKKARKWRVTLGKNHLGLYSDLNEAITVRKKEELKVYGEFAQ